MELKYVSLLLMSIVLLTRFPESFGKVEVLDDDNYDQFIGKKLPILVEFYAPWCGHCKALAPEWEKLEESYRKSEEVIIAKVDADANKATARNFAVSGYPTIKFFNAGDTEGVDFDGERNAASLSKFVNEKAGTNVKLLIPETAVHHIDDAQTFDTHVLNSNKYALVEFFAPWCGHCKRLAPDFEKVAQSFVGDDRVTVVAVDATIAKDLAQRYDVHGYPSLRWFQPDNPTPEMYGGSRKPKDFVEYINQKVGTKRTVGGGYEDHASLTPQLKQLIKEFHLAENDKEKLEVMEKAKEAESGVDEEFSCCSRFYSLTMKKLMKNADYVNDEHARLDRLIESGKVNKHKIAEFRLRQSIVNSFRSGAHDLQNDDVEHEL